jgi:hypothetical protein
MGRKSKQAGGNMPLTHYERTKKFRSSEYGTVSQRLAGHSQYQIGYCALSITSLENETIVLCTPSGYLYSESVLLEYLLMKTKEIKQQQILDHEQQQQQQNEMEQSVLNEKKKKVTEEFESAQKVLSNKKPKLFMSTGKRNHDHYDDIEKSKQDIKRTSYWLATSQTNQQQDDTTHPKHHDSIIVRPMSPSHPPPSPPDRPVSPCSEQPLRRKEIWPVQLTWDVRSSHKKVVMCAISQKSITTQPVMVYWIDKNKPGTIVLENVYHDIIMEHENKKDNARRSNSEGEERKVSLGICPLTSRKIKHVRYLQKSGSSFASSGQNIQVQQYRPTIT